MNAPAPLDPEAIRRDFPAPTVHARNLYHASAAMWDAWAAYDAAAEKPRELRHIALRHALGLKIGKSAPEHLLEAVTEGFFPREIEVGISSR